MFLIGLVAARLCITRLAGPFLQPAQFRRLVLDPGPSREEWAMLFAASPFTANSGIFACAAPSSARTAANLALTTSCSLSRTFRRSLVEREAALLTAFLVFSWTAPWWPSSSFFS